MPTKHIKKLFHHQVGSLLSENPSVSSRGGDLYTWAKAPKWQHDTSQRRQTLSLWSSDVKTQKGQKHQVLVVMAGLMLDRFPAWLLMEAGRGTWPG